MALAVSYRKLGLTANRYRSGHLTCRRFDRGGVIAVSVEREHPSRCRVVDNGVGISANADLLDFMKISEVENDSGRPLSDRNKSLANVRSDCYAVDAWRVRNRANDFAAVYVQHDYFGKMRDVHPPSVLINRLKIPGIITRSERDALENAITGAGNQRSQQEHRAR